MSVWLCIPFAGLLLCVALCPILASGFWEKYEPAVVAFWSIAVIAAFAVAYSPIEMTETMLEAIFNDYLTFIVMLFGLYCVAGNITFEGNLAGSPGVNVMLLAFGTLLSSVIGTTGSSMLMVRPVIKMNAWREKRSHIMIFFIFLISNIGGCLTPIGDPPLLMGFMRGVRFFWSLHLLPVLLLNMILLLVIFYQIDSRAYRREIAKGHMPDIHKPGTRIRFEGVHNLIFLLMIIIGVILSGVLPNIPLFQKPDGSLRGIPVGPGVTLGFPSLIEMAFVLMAAFLAMKTTPEGIRRRNHFTWGAIQEVAVLFVGIFLTMQPALILLKEMGPKLGLSHAWQMFWATGALSSFLDNTPTYLVFLTTAGSLGFSQGIMTSVGVIPVRMLLAISAGAVFMGANTYIGNAPNFMVKTISDENGVRMPSFFGYMKWSICILLPVFFLDMLVFFLRG